MKPGDPLVHGDGLARSPERDEAPIGLAVTTDVSGSSRVRQDTARASANPGLARTIDASTSGASVVAEARAALPPPRERASLDVDHGPAEPAEEVRDAAFASASLGLADTTDTSGRRRFASPFPSGGDEPLLKGMVLSRLFKSERAAHVGRFRILDQLGEGGMGTVYAAYDEQLDRKVAVKVLRPEVVQHSATGRVRLLREAQAMARLSHPNIVAVHEAGEEEGRIFVAMEFVRGQSLDRWIASAGERDTPRARPWREVLSVFLQAGRGLVAAHAAGIIHRDFKPHNAMISDEGVVKVLDFGLARASEARSEELFTTPVGVDTERGHLQRALTMTGAVLGTPAYMAPEQHLGEVADERSDQFSYCVALHEALYGAHPFPCGSMLELVAAVTEGRVQSPPAGAHVPGWLRKVVLKGLSRAPDHRYASMRELLTALSRDPVARRRRRVALASVLVASSAGSFALARVATPAPELLTPCAGVADELADVWSAARRAELAASFTASGVAYAQETWELVAPQLARYADAWIEARGDACQRHADGLVSGRMYDLEIACLEQRRASLDALAGALAEVDASGVGKAAVAVAGLPTLTRCGDSRALSAAMPPPEDAEEAAAVAARRETLARAREQEAMGAYAPALELVAEVLESPAATSYEALRAEALLRRGSALMERGEAQAAAAALDESLLLAIALGHAEVAAEAMAKWIFTTADRLVRPEEARARLPLARALARRVDDDPALQGLFWNNVVAVHLRLDQLEEALSACQRAIAEKRRAYPEGHPEIAFSLANLGFVQLRRNNYGEAIPAMLEAQRSLEAALGVHHPHLSMMSRFIARGYRAMGRLDDARATLRRAVEIASAAGGEGAQLDTALLDLGFLELDARNYEAARELFSRAAAMIERNDRAVDAVRPLFGLGHALLALGRRDEAEAAFARSVALTREAFGDDHAWTAELRAEAAALDEARGDLDRAIATYTATLEVLEREHGRDALKLVPLLGKLARAKLERRELAGAEFTTTRALEILRGQTVDSPLEISRFERLLGEVARAQGDVVKARELLARATAAQERVQTNQDTELALTRLEWARALAAERDAAGTGEEARAQLYLALAALERAGDGFTPERDEARQLLDRL